MKTYIFNTNFTKNDEKNNKLISKQKYFMSKCTGDIIISSTKGLYNYNSELQFNEKHSKSLYYGLYIEDAESNIKKDAHIPKQKAIYIASLWSEKDLYMCANNGFLLQGKHFNELVKDEQTKFDLGLYDLEKIYLIYVKGDETNNILLSGYNIEYDQVRNLSIISIEPLNTANVLQEFKGYKTSYSDNPVDYQLLNNSDCGYAIGDAFDLFKLEDNVAHVSEFYFINKYIEMEMEG